MPIPLALPILILAAEAAAELALYVGSAILVAKVVSDATKARDEAVPTSVTPCPQEKKCPPCTYPVGTILYEIHRVPPSAAHWPCSGDHVHWFLQQQNPKNCQCFLKRNFRPVTCLPSGGTPTLPPGAVPL